MQRCPNCRARDPGNQQCRRCGMDLAGLTAAEAAADYLVGDALRKLAAGEIEVARDRLQRARALRRDPLLDLLIGFTTHRDDANSTPDPQHEPTTLSADE